MGYETGPPLFFLFAVILVLAFVASVPVRNKIIIVIIYIIIIIIFLIDTPQKLKLLCNYLQISGRWFKSTIKIMTKYNKINQNSTS